MTDTLLNILVVEGTIRDARNSIHPARYVTDRFQEKGHDVELFVITEYVIPMLTKRRCFRWENRYREALGKHIPNNTETTHIPTKKLAAPTRRVLDGTRYSTLEQLAENDEAAQLVLIVAETKLYILLWLPFWALEVQVGTQQISVPLLCCRYIIRQKLTVVSPRNVISQTKHVE